MFGWMRRRPLDVHELDGRVERGEPWSRPTPVGADSITRLERRFAQLEAESLGDRQTALAWRVAQLEDAARSHGWELGSRGES